MPARTVARTELSLTIAPRPAEVPAPVLPDDRRARYLAWGALLVSSAAIAGYLLGQTSLDSPTSRSEWQSPESTGLALPSESGS